MFNNGFELRVEVNGKFIPEFGHKGKTYVEGRKNNSYRLHFRNSRAERVLVIPTVDNLSVVDGKPHNSLTTGYVVQGYSSLSIAGWRTSTEEVRAFEFNTKSSSFAGKTAGEANCGVIGAQVFAELKPRCQDIHIHHHHTYPAFPPPIIVPASQPYESYWYKITSGSCDASAGYGGLMYFQSTEGALGPQGLSGPAGERGCCSMNVQTLFQCSSASNSAPDFNLGTSCGEALVDKVSSVSFERGICLATFEIYYSDRDGLVKDGIPVDKSPVLAHFPNAFGGFCQIPQ